MTGVRKMRAWSSERHALAHRSMESGTTRHPSLFLHRGMKFMGSERRDQAVAWGEVCVRGDVVTPIEIVREGATIIPNLIPDVIESGHKIGGRTVDSRVAVSCDPVTRLDHFPTRKFLVWKSLTSAQAALDMLDSPVDELRSPVREFTQERCGILTEFSKDLGDSIALSKVNIDKAVDNKSNKCERSCN